MFQDPELMINDEIYDLIFTDTDCSPIKATFIWRKFRREKDRSRTRCSACNSDINGYSEGEKTCPYCKGYGHIYDDVIVEGYLSRSNIRRSFYNLDMPTMAGKSDNSRYELYTTRDTLIGQEDRILIPSYTEDGRIAIPLNIVETTQCVFSKTMVASRRDSDFNIALLEG